ncbi:MAG: hypothetical protein ACREXX_17275 [Gammaproteobacteria bacterium]
MSPAVANPGSAKSEPLCWRIAITEPGGRTVEVDTPSGWTLAEWQAYADRYHGAGCIVTAVLPLPAPAQAEVPVALSGVSPEFTARLSPEDLADIAAGDIPLGTVQVFEAAAIAREAEDLKKFFDERAAILEHDAGLPRPEAELEAARITATLARNRGYLWASPAGGPGGLPRAAGPATRHAWPGGRPTPRHGQGGGAAWASRGAAGGVHRRARGEGMRGKQCQCADGRYGGCGRVFSRSSVFDRHHVLLASPVDGRYKRCLTDGELEARGIVLGADGVWRGKGSAQEWLGKLVQRRETGGIEAQAPNDPSGAQEARMTALL